MNFKSYSRTPMIGGDFAMSTDKKNNNKKKNMNNSYDSKTREKGGERK